MRIGIAVLLFLTLSEGFITETWAGPEQDSLVKTLNDMAAAVRDLPRTHDVQSVLRFYAKDYHAILDGEWQTLKDVEQWLRDLDAQLSDGRLDGFGYDMVDIKAKVMGNMGWMTYGCVYKPVVDGSTLEEEHCKCTAIYRKRRGRWVIQHEHCSSSVDDGDLN